MKVFKAIIPIGLAWMLTACITPTPTPIPLQQLTVDMTGAGTGKITSSPSGINCGTTCSHSYTKNQNLTLTASANTGSVFTGWSGDCSDLSCIVSMDGDKNVTANFALDSNNGTPTNKLTVVRNGTGSGAVTSSPAGIDCGNTCSSNFDKDTNVLLSAAPSAGSSFAGWSGACSGTGTCTITMNAEKTAYATFTAENTPNPQTLNINFGGTGGGSVKSNPTGIDCSSNCSSSFAKDASVVLTATANSTSSFTGWSGECGGTGACTVSMTASKTVTANFSSLPDTIKPMVNISSPTNAQTVSSSSLTVTGTASDNTAVTGLEYSLNNAARVTLSAGTSFNFAVTLAAGMNTINVYAKDAVGNEGVSSINVTYSQPSFTITPEQNVFFVGQKSVAFWKINIAGRQNFSMGGDAFDSVTLENNAILGTGASKIQFSYRKTDSTQDEIVLEIGAGSSVPVGDYAMTVRATSGSIVKESAVTVRVAPCSLGCQ